MLIRNPPFIIADASSYQGSDPNWGALLAHPHVVGVVLKATQGTRYAYSWFANNWQRVRELAGGRYGNDWFRGAYHYLECKDGTRESGRAQADFFLAHVARCGGWGAGDMHVFVDVEEQGNESASSDEIIDCTTGFAERVREVRGPLCRVVRYGRGLMRDRGIASKMGCDAVWNPGYTATMPTNGLAPFTRNDVVLWQYTDGTSYAASSLGLPQHIEGFDGGLDLSVYVDGPRPPTLTSLRQRLVGPLATVIACALLVLAALVAHHNFAA